MRRPPQPVQLLGSLLAALAIAALAIAVVTAHFGPTSTAELEARENLVEERIELREERAERRDDARERQRER